MEKKCGKYLLSRLYKKSTTTQERLEERERVSTLYYVFRPETPLLFKNDGRRRRRTKNDDGRMDPVRATAGG